MVFNKNKNRVFRFNRRIRNLTDYSLRLKLLRSHLTRLVVRKSNKAVLVQFIDYATKGDAILTSAKTSDLKKLGYEAASVNLVSAYLTGYLAGKRLLKTGFDKDCIVDLGLQRSFNGGRLYAAVKGVADSGVKVRVSETVLPSEDRLKGAHLTGKDALKAVDKVKKAIDSLK